MRIGMLGDIQSINTQSWINGLQEAGAEVVCWDIPKRSNVARFIYFIFDIIELRFWLKRNNPDLLIGYRTTSYGFMGALMYFHPFVIAAQGIDDVYSENRIIHCISNFTSRYAICKADLIQVWAPNMSAALLKRGADPEKLFILPRGIDINHFTYRQRDFIGLEMRLIVTRSLFPEYHIDIIIDALYILKDKLIIPNIQLTVVGSGPMELELKQQALGLGIEDHVSFVGKIPNVIISKYLDSHDYYISMPDTEGASSSLFEAFACGLYPIVSDLPGNRTWIEHRENGILVNINDSQSLANEILYAWNNPVHCRTAVFRNRKFAEENLSREKNANLMLNKYDKLIKLKSGNQVSC